MEIPILNIYYLLCYAWNQLDESEIVDISTDDSTSLLNLFARVLVSGTNHVLKRGLDRGYINHSETIRGIKGKVNFNITLKRQTLANARIQCEFDEMSYDILHNHILKTTIRELARSRDVDKNWRNELKYLTRALGEIEEIPLSSVIFSRVQLHRNNSFYRFLINICEMIYHYYLVSEDTGEGKFRDFIRDDDKMAKLFEEFVRNFYKIELAKEYPVYTVKGSEYIYWDVKNTDDGDVKHLPVMKTDISLKTPSTYIIIDTKYAKDAFQSYYKKTVKSKDLYQLFAYLKNIEKRGSEFIDCKGILLYPTVDKDLDLQYEIQGHKISVRTIDLSKDWQKIHNNLMLIIGKETSE